MHDPDVFGFIWLMLVRTRCIDGLMERAVRNGATQLVIPGRRIRYEGPSLRRIIEGRLGH